MTDPKPDPHEQPVSGVRLYRWARTEQGARELLWVVYEGPRPGAFDSERQVASFVRRKDALAFVQPNSEERCRCGHELAWHARPTRINCLSCNCSIPWPEDD